MSFLVVKKLIPDLAGACITMSLLSIAPRKFHFVSKSEDTFSQLSSSEGCDNIAYYPCRKAGMDIKISAILLVEND